jgi:hypothetical protein
MHLMYCILLGHTGITAPLSVGVRKETLYKNITVWWRAMHTEYGGHMLLTPYFRGCGKGNPV